MGEIIRFVIEVLRFILTLVLAMVSAIHQIDLSDPGPAASAPASQPVVPAELSRPAPLTSLEAEQAILEQINAERAAAGLPPFTFDPTLAEIARLRAEDMLARDYVSHYDPATGERADWVLERRFGVALGSEIIFWTGGSVKLAAVRAVPWWMGSEGHRANVLGQYGRVGVGLAASGGRVMVVAVFLP